MIELENTLAAVHSLVSKAKVKQYYECSNSLLSLYFMKLIYHLLTVKNLMVSFFLANCAIFQNGQFLPTSHL